MITMLTARFRTTGLMEQKGMHVNEDAKKKKDEVPSTTPAKDATAKKDKPSLGDRIKAKFRKH